MITIISYFSLTLLIIQKIRLAKFLPVSSIILLTFPIIRFLIEFYSLNFVSQKTKLFLINSYVIEVIVFAIVIFLTKNYFFKKGNIIDLDKIKLSNFNYFFIIVTFISYSGLSFIFYLSGESGDLRNVIYSSIGPIRYLITNSYFIISSGCINIISRSKAMEFFSKKNFIYWLILIIFTLFGLFSGSKYGGLIFLNIFLLITITNFNFKKFNNFVVSKNFIKGFIGIPLLIIPTIVIFLIRNNFNILLALYSLNKRILYISGYNIFLDRLLNNYDFINKNPLQENLFSFVNYYFSRSDISMNIGNSLKSLALNRGDIVGGPIAHSIKSYWLMSGQTFLSPSVYLFCINHIIILTIGLFIIFKCAKKKSFIFQGISLAICSSIFTSFTDAYTLYSTFLPIIFFYFGFQVFLNKFGKYNY